MNRRTGPDLLGQMYQRLRGRYLVIAVGLWAFVGAIVTAVGGVAFALFARRPLSVTVEYVGVLEVVNVVAMAVTYLVTRPLIRPLLAWMAGAERDAVAAWQALAGLAPRMVARGIAAYSAVFLVAIAPTHTMLKVPVSSAPYMVVGFELAILFAAGLDALTWDWIMRPVLLEIDAALAGDDAPRAKGIRLRTRVLTVPIVSLVTVPVVVVGIMTPVHASPAARLGLAILVSVLIGASFGLLATGFAARVVLEPVNALIGATQRVGKGDLTVRVAVAAADELADLTAAFNRMVRGLAERQALESALGAYVDPLAQRILNEGVLLKGAEVDVTVMMLDIRDFTSMSERSSPAQIVERLNDLWSTVIPIVHRYHGHVNKFVGDAILAVFGAPVSIPDHAKAATGAAAAIVDTIEQQFEGRVRVGIGINTGTVLAGTLGGGGRLEFTVIGDAVNVASRVQDLTKDKGYDVLITGATHQAISDLGAVVEPVGVVALRGKSESVSLYGLRQGAGNIGRPARTDQPEGSKVPPDSVELLPPHGLRGRSDGSRHSRNSLGPCSSAGRVRRRRTVPRSHRHSGLHQGESDRAGVHIKGETEVSQ